MTYFEKQRRQLIKELRQCGIVKDSIIQSINEVSREEFLPEDMRPYAYQNIPLPIEEDQTISQPYIVALMTDLLDLHSGLKVLEIGTGSGYQAAILSLLSKQVFTVERHVKLYEQAKARFERLGYQNIICKLDDGSGGWPEQAPFDRIIITAATPEKIVPELMQQLVPGGIMVVPLEDMAGNQVLCKLVKTEAGFTREKVLSVQFVPLICKKD